MCMGTTVHKRRGCVLLASDGAWRGRKVKENWNILSDAMWHLKAIFDLSLYSPEFLHQKKKALI